MKRTIFPCLAAPAMVKTETMQAAGSVAEVMGRLESAVNEAGTTVFACVDHGAGA